MMALVFPKFAPILARLEKMGELPLVTRCMYECVKITAFGFYLPAFGVVPALVGLDVLVVRRFGNRRNGRFVIEAWFWAVLLVFGVFLCAFGLWIALA